MASAHLHRSYNAKRFVIACATSLCAVVFNLNWRCTHVSAREWFSLLNAIVAPTPATVIWPHLVRRPGQIYYLDAVYPWTLWLRSHLRLNLSLS